MFFFFFLFLFGCQKCMLQYSALHSSETISLLLQPGAQDLLCSAVAVIDDLPQTSFWSQARLFLNNS